MKVSWLNIFKLFFIVGLTSTDPLERWRAEWLLQSGWEDLLIHIGPIFKATSYKEKVSVLYSFKLSLSLT